MTTRKPRGTGYCTACGRRILLTTQGRLFLHGGIDTHWGRRVRCPDSMSSHYKPGPTWEPKEIP